MTTNEQILKRFEFDLGFGFKTSIFQINPFSEPVISIKFRINTCMEAYCLTDVLDALNFESMHTIYKKSNIDCIFVYPNDKMYELIRLGNEKILNSIKCINKVPDYVLNYNSFIKKGIRML